MWYKKRVMSMSSSFWRNSERYGWFTVGIDWDTPEDVAKFQEDEDIRDSVEDNCFIATSQLERIGFSKQHSYLIFSPDYVHNEATGEEAGAVAEAHSIKFPTGALYNDDFSQMLVHEWAHRYFYNMPKEARTYFQNQYDEIVKNFIETDDSPQLMDMIEEVVPEDIKESFPDDMSAWKLYVANSLHKQEMGSIRDYVRQKGNVPSAYASVNSEELWSECVSNYSKLDRDFKQIISNVIGGTY